MQKTSGDREMKEIPYDEKYSKMRIMYQIGAVQLKKYILRDVMPFAVIIPFLIFISVFHQKR